MFRLNINKVVKNVHSEWIMPKFQKNMEYLRIKDISFTSAKSKKRNLCEMLITGSSNNSVASENEPEQYCKTSKGELNGSNSGTKA